MPQVSVQAVERYEEALIDQAVSAHFDALHVAQDLHPGMRVVLKPNLLAPRDPELAVTTHPAILAGIARWLRAHNIRHITLCESSSGLHTTAALRKLYTACGMDELRPLMVLNEDISSVSRNGFNILTPIAEADYVINVCKLKTHSLTTMTAGVKNLFGCIPGLQKPEWHCRKPSLPAFSGMLIDLCETIRPSLTLVDAVEGMEGNGPGGGTKRHVGMTLCARSPYALDEACAALMGLAPSAVPTILVARKRGLPGDPITYVGDSLTPCVPAFTLPDAQLGKERILTGNGLFHLLCRRGRKYPTVQSDKCVGCGKCAESCPKHLIDIKDRKAVIRRKGCISCFCCQEMCAFHAIDVQ